MYNHHFGLQKTPFSMTPDPALLFMPPQHREALAGLTYSILNRKGFTVLIGDAGTGKTTLLGRMLRSLPPTRVHASVIHNPTLTPQEFLELALMDFGIGDIPSSKAQRLKCIQELLLANHSTGKVSVLIVDEAHKLSTELLEEVRLLSNFEFADQKLLQIVLTGQNELGDILNETNLRQLKQRIAVRLTIAALGRNEVQEYIRYRWTKCGGAPALPFTDEALTAIASLSQGIPRVINAICDNALTAAFGVGVNIVDLSHIQMVAHDLDLKPAVEERKEELLAAPQPVIPVAPPEVSRTTTLTPARVDFTSLRIFDQPPPPKTSILTRWTKKFGFTS